MFAKQGKHSKLSAEVETGMGRGSGHQPVPVQFPSLPEVKVLSLVERCERGFLGYLEVHLQKTVEPTGRDAFSGDRENSPLRN